MSASFKQICFADNALSMNKCELAMTIEDGVNEQQTVYWCNRQLQEYIHQQLYRIILGEYKTCSPRMALNLVLTPSQLMLFTLGRAESFHPRQPAPGGFVVGVDRRIAQLGVVFQQGMQRFHIALV